MIRFVKRWLLRRELRKVLRAKKVLLDRYSGKGEPLGAGCVREWALLQGEHSRINEELLRLEL